MSDEKVGFILDLDIKEFSEGILKAKGQIQDLGSKENLTELIEGLSQVGIALGAVGLAAFTMKEALDLTIEGEQIRKINSQFEQLTATAGISSSKLKEGLEEQAKGLIDNTDLLQIANRALVTMGTSAAKLPDILELARKSTQVFGGDFKSNFENMTKALEMGNVRMLKHMGIIVDAKKAVDEFAKSHGVASDELTEFAKRQAIAEAAVSQGKKAFAGVNEDMKNATNTMAVLKVTLSEISEVFVLAFEKTIGPTVRRVLLGLKDSAVDLKRYFTATFGEGMEQNTAQIERLNLKIKDTQKIIEQLQAKQGTALDFTPGDTSSRLQSLKAGLVEYQAQLETLQNKKKEIATEDTAAEQKRQEEAKAFAGGVTEDLINKEALEKNELHFRGEMLKIKKQALDEEVKNITSLPQIEQLIQSQQVQSEMEHQLKLDEIKSQYKNKERERDILLAAEKRRFEVQERADAETTNKQRQKLLESYQKNATNVFDGIGRAFLKHSQMNKAEQADFGKKGEQVYLSLQTHSINAFEAMGAAMVQGKDIASAAADAMKSIFLNMIADRAQAEGSLLLLTSIWPPNPIGLSAGAGLLALSGALRALAGSSGGASAAGVGGAGVSGGGGTTQAQDVANAQPLSNTSGAAPISGASADQGQSVSEMQRPQRSVTVAIAGNYYDTDQTRRTLLNMIREETDATDFKYTQIGQA